MRSRVHSLGVDVGTTNLKVALVDLDPTDPADPVRWCRVATEPTPRAGADVVESALRLIRLVREGRPVDCVGIASMAETGVPLDRDDRPLGELLRWDGQRGQEDVAALTATYGAEQLFAATGVRPSAKVPLLIWRRLQRTDPDRWAAMASWAGAADLLTLELTGALVTDHTLAGRTMAYRLADPGQPPMPSFDADLLDIVGLRPEQLPAIASPAGPAGRVRANQPAGLPAGTPVVVAGHDHQVGAWAAGVRQPGDVADSIGTAEALIRVLDRRPATESVRRAGMSLTRTADGTSEALVAGSSSAGAMLTWWTEEVLRRSWPGLDPDVALEAAADRAQPSGAFVLPYLNGRQTPAPDPAARPRLVGMDVDADPVELAGALLDGLCLQARWMLTTQAELAEKDGADPPVRVLGSVATEGSAWLRTKAVVGPGRTWAVEVAEPVAIGSALLAAHRSGLVDPALTLPGWLVPEQPDPAYDAVFDAFVAAASTTADSVS